MYAEFISASFTCFETVINKIKININSLVSK